MAYLKSRMKSLFVAVGMMALLVQSAQAQLPPPPLQRMITVSGTAEEKFAPDQAIVSASLVSRDRDLNVAKQDNDKMVERIVMMIRDFKIPKEKISAANVNISPEYTYEHGKQQFKGYVVNRYLSITVDELAIHERVLSALIDAKVDQVHGVQFSIADYEGKAKNVRVKAVKNAREKAEVLANAAGAKIGPVLIINTGGAVSQPPVMYARATMMDAAAEEKSSVAPSLPGQTTIQESVTVTFALE